MSALEQVIPEGYKHTEVGVIPAEWGVNDLATLCRSPITYGIVQCGPHITDGVPYIRVSDMSTRSLDVTSMLRTSKEIAAGFKRSKVDEGDIVYALRGKIGEVRIVDETVAGANLTQGTARLAPKPQHSGNYIFWALQSEKSKEQADGESKGSTFKEITLGNLQKILIALPSSSPEQTAIANALSDVDALLTELEKLIAKKQAIKTATMQQLLTGKTRLPQFATYTEGALEGKNQGQPKGTKPSELGEIPEDWDVYKLPDVVWYQEGPGLRKWQFKTKGLKVINITNLQQNGFLDLDKTDRHVSWDEYEKTYKHFACDEGDLVIASSGNSYCKSSTVRKCDLPLLMNTSVIRFKPVGDFSKGFMDVCLKSPYFKDQIDLLITGGAQPNFGPAHLDKIKIPAPSNPEEQTAIATILSDMDNEIQTLEQRLAKTRQIKQGMMQELLTGRTRLPL